MRYIQLVLATFGFCMLVFCFSVQHRLVIWYALFNYPIINKIVFYDHNDQYCISMFADEVLVANSNLIPCQEAMSLRKRSIK